MSLDGLGTQLICCLCGEIDVPLALMASRSSSTRAAAADRAFAGLAGVSNVAYTIQTSVPLTLMARLHLQHHCCCCCCL